jgi:uncharacterized protein
MKTIKAFIKRHPLLSYFALTFAISWSGFLIAAGVGVGGLSPTPDQLQTIIPYAIPAMLVGPSVADILLTVSFANYKPLTACVSAPCSRKTAPDE